jgi:hypothetical protein
MKKQKIYRWKVANRLVKESRILWNDQIVRIAPLDGNSIAIGINIFGGSSSLSFTNHPFYFKFKKYISDIYGIQEGEHTEIWKKYFKQIKEKIKDR